MFIVNTRPDEIAAPVSTGALVAPATGCDPRGVYPTECIYQLVLESQLPDKIVNSLFAIANQDIKLTVELPLPVWRAR